MRSAVFPWLNSGAQRSTASVGGRAQCFRTSPVISKASSRLLDAHGSLDLRRVRDVVRGFAEALDAPELLADLESILTAKGR
jgi:hypothetical protein